jgi:hypothetical protein
MAVTGESDGEVVEVLVTGDRSPGDARLSQYNLSFPWI